MTRAERTLPVPEKNKSMIRFDTKKADLSFETVNEFQEKFKGFQEKTDPYKDQHTATIGHDNPITLYGIGDVHFGGDSSKMKLFMREKV